MKIAVGMSGGVDSSVAALELKKKGYEVIGMTIKTWPKEGCGGGGARTCCSLEAVARARACAEEMGVPYHVVDLSKEFSNEVKKYFADEYASGRTPNPCIFCNSRIKFGYMWEIAKSLGAEKVATGHYAMIKEEGGDFFLAESADKWQDQSYFLYDVKREMLPRLEFPLGGYSKDRVRELAEKAGLMTAKTEASQDLCFVTGDNDYRDFLAASGVKAFEPGNIVDMSGKVLGKHKGIASYTVGQRQGLGVAAAEPLYVLKIDVESNRVIVGPREQALNRNVRVAGLNWLVDGGKKVFPMEVEAKIRYKSKKAKAVISPLDRDEILLEFEEDQFAPTPGQAAVFYKGDIVVGGGWIEEILG